MKLLLTLAHRGWVAPDEVFVLYDAGVTQTTPDPELFVHLLEVADSHALIIRNLEALVNAVKCWVSKRCERTPEYFSLAALAQLVINIDHDTLCELIAHHFQSRLLCVHLDFLFPAWDDLAAEINLLRELRVFHERLSFLNHLLLIVDQTHLERIWGEIWLRRFILLRVGIQRTVSPIEGRVKLLGVSLLQVAKV